MTGRQVLLNAIVDLSIAALKKEDRIIGRALAKRGRRGGLFYVQNERFQQYAIWKKLLCRFDARMECDGYCDIVVQSGGVAHHIEMKNWREQSDGSQMASIRKDLDKLSERQSGFLLLTSMNPPNVTTSNIEHLDKVLIGLDPSDRQMRTFRTINGKGAAIEVWVAGWPVPSRLQPTSA